MGEKLLIGPLNQGLRNDVTAFNVDNDSFPTLINAYQWRSRVKRKRGTSFITRLTKFFDSTSLTYNPGTITLTLDGSGTANLITNFLLNTLSPDAALTPGSITLTNGGNVYTDMDGDGLIYLDGMPPTLAGTVNYATGVITIASEANNVLTAQFSFFPNLPVMGIEDLELNPSMSTGNLLFDTRFVYNLINTTPYDNYNVNFYKNPATSGTYTQKTNWTEFHWNGQDYQQFWSTNYQGAFWTCNGINVPFSVTNIGMQFQTITAIAINQASGPARADITLSANHELEVGDFVFVNEVVGLTGINNQTGYVIADLAANQVRVEFPTATLGGAYTSGGILQYLTSSFNPNLDCIRWYDGDPTNGDINAPTPSTDLGWVNFMPPLSKNVFSIAGLPQRIYYLVGARIIFPFKDRLLFLGAVVQASSGNPIYLQDTVVYSENGTPYYTASFTDEPDIATNLESLLVPLNETATPASFFADVTGFGGNVSAGVAQAILTVGAVKDVLIVGFNDSIQTQLVYTGNDIIPFTFHLINSEYGSSSTFSAIPMDTGVLTRGSRAFVMTTQQNANRIDLMIPDEVFQIKLNLNGAERLTSQRDFINEWVYFTYPSNEATLGTQRFPDQTLLFNYRDNSWAIFRESYTTYGYFRKQTGFTWQTVGNVYPSWNEWNDPWNAGTSTLLQIEVLAGNQQGFILERENGTQESASCYIQSFVGNTVTSPDHNLDSGDFIQIEGVLGTTGEQVNGKVFSIFNITEDSFQLNPPIASGTYLGKGVFKRLYRPFIQTKQFPIAWNMSRKTRLGSQQYLLTRTTNAEMQLLIFLSQDAADAFNDTEIVPEIGDNNALIYSTVLFTCPESTNLGLTQANSNLNTPTASGQSQIWHRLNTSLIGDTVQLGFTISNEQMRAYTPTADPASITGATQTNPCVISIISTFEIGNLIRITDVEGMTELNAIDGVFNSGIWRIIDKTPVGGPTTSITIECDATGFTAYTNGGTATPVSSENPTAEIELHSIILDVAPSQLLV